MFLQLLFGKAALNGTGRHAVKADDWRANPNIGFSICCSYLTILEFCWSAEHLCRVISQKWAKRYPASLSQAGIVVSCMISFYKHVPVAPLITDIHCNVVLYLATIVTRRNYRVPVHASISYTSNYNNG